MTYMLLIFVSGVLLVAVLAFLKERRLRLALQEILKRLLFRWRADGKNDTQEFGDAVHHDPADEWL
jgi:hypothetical protein